VLEDLRAKQIQHLRRVSKYFCSLIDNNLNALAQSVEGRAHLRLQLFLNSTILPPTNLTFLQALTRFIEHRSIAATLEERMFDCYGFALLWYCRHGGTFPFLRPPHAEAVFVMQLRDATNVLMDVHLRYHLPYTYQQSSAGTEPIVGINVNIFMRASRNVRTRYGWDDDSLREWYWQLRWTPGGYLRARPLPERGQGGTDDDDELLCWPLTELSRHPTTILDSIRRSRWKHGLCSITALTQHFGIPAMPLTRYLAYCVESEWAWNQVKRAVVDVQALSLFERAAVLDEMYRY